MSAELIQRIVHQLDQKCRDVSPRSYPQGKEASEVAPAQR
jgi:hypothetical protein